MISNGRTSTSDGTVSDADATQQAHRLRSLHVACIDFFIEWHCCRGLQACRTIAVRCDLQLPGLEEPAMHPGRLSRSRPSLGTLGRKGHSTLRTRLSTLETPPQSGFIQTPPEPTQLYQYTQEALQYLAPVFASQRIQK
eukprot:2114689-Amphidinium_carterae.1